MIFHGEFKTDHKSSPIEALAEIRLLRFMHSIASPVEGWQVNNVVYNMFTCLGYDVTCSQHHIDTIGKVDTPCLVFEMVGHLSSYIDVQCIMFKSH